MIAVMLMASSGHRQKIAAARKASRTPINGLEMANQKDGSQFESWGIRSVFMLLSQAFEDRHFTEREISFETLNEVRRIWIARPD
jgi:hypothetical protein